MDKVIKSTILASVGSLIGFCLLIAIFFGIAFCWSNYLVWSQHKSGEAELGKQEQINKIRISKAKAELEAAKYQKEAIETVGKAARDYPEYREQEFISDFGEAIKKSSIQKIYFIPTNNGIPLVKDIK